jgi:hypothetical protein
MIDLFVKATSKFQEWRIATAGSVRYRFLTFACIGAMQLIRGGVAVAIGRYAVHA